MLPDLTLSPFIPYWLGAGVAAYLLLFMATGYRNRPPNFGQAIQAASWQPRAVLLALVFCLCLPFVALPIQVYEYYKRYQLYRRDKTNPQAEGIESGLSLLAELVRMPGSAEARENYERIWNDVEELRQQPLNIRRDLTMKTAADWLAGAHTPRALTAGLAEPEPEPDATSSATQANPDLSAPTERSQ